MRHILIETTVNNLKTQLAQNGQRGGIKEVDGGGSWIVQSRILWTTTI